MGHAHAGPDNNLIGKVGMSRVWPQKVVQSAPQSISPVLHYSEEKTA